MPSLAPPDPRPAAVAADPPGAAPSGAAARRVPWQRALASLVLVACAAWSARLLWWARDYVPMWDARIYAECAVSAAERPFALEALRCGGHPSHAYIGVLSLLQRLDVGNPQLLLLANAALLALGAVAFARLLRSAFPDEEVALERALLVGALLLDPAVLSSVLHVNVDVGVLAFLVGAAAALAERRLWIAALFGLLASFSKETGALLYAALAAIHVAVLALPQPVPRPVRLGAYAGVLGALLSVLLVPWGPWSAPLAVGVALAAARLASGTPWRIDGRRWLAVAATHAPLALPPVLYAAHLLWRGHANAAGGALWAGTSGGDVAQMLLHPQLGPEARTFLALILVLNFHWIPSVALAADLAVGLRRFVARLAPRTVPHARADAVMVVTLFAVAAVYLVTRFPSLVMARYVVPVFPYVFAAALASLLRLRVPAVARRVALAAFVALLAWSARATPDPVSRALWGTYRVGRHELLYVNSFAGTCCGRGLNQAIYNLEFLRFAQLTQAALSHVRPVATGRTLVLPGPADWLSINALDRDERRRLRGRDLTVPTLMRAQDLADGRALPDTAWFLDVAYFPGDAELARVARLYHVGAPDSLWIDGYGIGVRRLVRRADAGSAPR
ncbi:hypothetical protein [Roseisolibacter agri]|uniref:Uncharacterized protein n=1 Tax=Roseisolibacter agri TaxID=2014610 RepID=A0AA37QD50_9BACT|nr:hypothetical protein [Roseisolibacter agri]GLC26706.1 hypothetical protein rosag_32190 [Roseisolibacter agri]